MDEIKEKNFAKQTIVRVTQSQKTGKKYVYVVIPFSDDCEKRAYLEPVDLCDLLDVTPRQLEKLEPGDYPIK